MCRACGWKRRRRRSKKKCSWEIALSTQTLLSENLLASAADQIAAKYQLDSVIFYQDVVNIEDALAKIWPKLVYETAEGNPTVYELLKRSKYTVDGSHILAPTLTDHGKLAAGKTTLAYIIANEKGANIKTSSGPVIEKPGDLAGLLTSLEKGDILFIDEIHRLNTAVEEYLYSAMEDFFIDIMIDQGPGARSVRLTIPEFTLIGATTRQGLLSAPLRSRFELSLRLDY